MRLLKPLVLTLFGLLASVGLAQIPTPQINLSGNIGCQGFPCLNNGTLIMASDANRTMTALETSALYIKVTSSVSLTATRNLIIPVGRFMFTIENATTGGQSIQIIGASGAGVTIANGTTVAVWNDGTNVVQIGSSGSGFTAGGDLSGSSSSQTVIGLDTVPFCSGYTPTNGQFIQLTTGGSPNPCYTAATGTGTTSPGGTNGQIQYNNSGAFGGSAATITSAGAATIPSVNTVINAGTSLSTAIASCGSANTTIQITQTIAVGTGITVPSNCTLLFQSAGNLTGTSITINGAVQSPARQIFGSGLAVTFGTVVTSVPVEWFGGKNDATGTVGGGTDNLAAFNAAVAALTAGTITGQVSSGSTGFYRISGPIAIAKPNVNIAGPVASGANGMTILIDSASANAINVNAGALGNTFRNFNIYRTQLATGTAAGLSVNGSGGGISTLSGIVIEGVSSQDSMRPFYLKGFTGGGVGHFAYNFAGWGFNGLVGSAPSGACGFYIDSADGTVGDPTQGSAPNAAGSGVGGTGLSGLCSVGINVSELHLDNFQIIGLDYGIDLEVTPSSNFYANAIHIVNSVLDVCGVVCLKINGAKGTGGAFSAPHVFIQGGIVYAVGGIGSMGVFAENSENIAINGVQFLAGNVGSGAETDVVLNAVDGFEVNDNQFSGSSLINVSCINSNHGTVNDNQIKNANNTSGAAAIKLAGCTNVSVQGNSIAGNGIGVLFLGMSFDSGSSNNGPWSLNKIDTATVTTPVTDAGTSNNTLSPSILVLNGGTPLTGQSSAQSQIVTCTTGGTGSQFCGADGTWHSAAGAGTVTSVAQTVPSSLLSISGSPITSSGTLAIGLTNAAQNSVWAGPATGGAGAPSYQTAPTISAANMTSFPTFNQNTTGNAATATNIAGGALGSAPYQNAANTTLFIASPTTTDTYFYGWTPTGSAIAPGAKSMTTYLASPAAIGGTSPSTVRATVLGATSLNAGGLVKSAPSTGNLSTAVVGDVIALWTGTCSSTTFLRGDGACMTPSGSGNTTSTSLSTNVLPKANGANSIIDSSISDDGTTVATGEDIAALTIRSTALSVTTLPICPNGASGKFTVSGCNAATATNLLVCADISASGTAQSCTTTPTFSPAANSCVVYTTTTANTGAGLTFNINSLGAKSVAKWLNSTTTLAAGDLPANVPVLACYTGTNWNLSDIGNAPGGGSTTWNGILAPTGAQSIAMGNFTTTWTFGAATGSTTPMVTMTDTASNTGTGPVARFATAASSQGFPAQFLQRGTALLTVGATGGGTGSIFAGTLAVNKTSNVNGDGLEVQGGIYVTSGASTFQSSVASSAGFELAMYNSNQTSGTGAGIQFDGQNTGFSPAQIANIAGVMTAGAGASFLTGKIVFSTANNAAPVAVADISALGDFDLLLGHLTFAQTTPPVASSCGGGTVAAGGTDNSFAVTGITAATGCTITFNRAIKQGICTAGTSTGIASGPSSISTSAVTFTMAALTGTLYANCW